jgi:hypothetical protein
LSYNNDTTGRWPVKRLYPLAGALLPYNRFITEIYIYKNGYLGEPRKEMLAITRRSSQMAADSTVKATALHYTYVMLREK